MFFIDSFQNNILRLYLLEQLYFVNIFHFNPHLQEDTGTLHFLYPLSLIAPLLNLKKIAAHLQKCGNLLKSSVILRFTFILNREKDKDIECSKLLEMFQTRNLYIRLLDIFLAYKTFVFLSF